jgi:hypothetical protein
MYDTSQIYQCEFHHPQENLAGNGRERENPEAVFTTDFIQSYQRQFSKIHSGTTRKETLFVREVPVSGNGIADLMVLNWAESLNPFINSSSSFEAVAPTVRAFEFKLSKWRSGMMQAHRYRYFSHVSILVVPKRKLRTVKPQLELFKALRVGLWGFDPETGSIVRLYTPRPKQQSIPKYADKALQQIRQTIQS